MTLSFFLFIARRSHLLDICWTLIKIRLFSWSDFLGIIIYKVASKLLQAYQVPLAIDYLYLSLRSCRAYKPVSHTLRRTVIINHPVLSTRSPVCVHHIYTHVFVSAPFWNTRNIIIAHAMKWRLVALREWTWLSEELEHKHSISKNLGHRALRFPDSWLGCEHVEKTQ